MARLRVPRLPLRPSTGVRRRTAARTSLIGFAALMATLLLAVAGTLRPVAAEGGSGFKLLGRIPFTAKNVASGLYNITIDPQTQRGFTVYTATAAGVPTVRVLDLAAMRTVKEVAAPGNGNLGQGNSGPNGAVDTKRHRILFFLTSPQPVPHGACGVQAAVMAWLDEASLTWSTVGLPCIPGTTGDPTQGTSGDALIPWGVTYDAASDSVYVVGQDSTDKSPGAASHGAVPVRHFLLQVNPLTGALKSSVQLDCDAPDTPGVPVDYLTVALYNNSAYATCLKKNPFVSGSTAASDFTLATRVSLGGGGALLSNPAPADERQIGSSFGSLLDSGGGIMVLPSSDPAYDLGAYVFDMNSGLFRGFVPTSNDQSITGASQIRATGLDPSNGRLYLQTRQGLIVSDVRNLPVPVGLMYPDLAEKTTSSPGPLGNQISIDPTRSRLYIPDFQDKVQAWDVYEDDTPPVAPPGGATNPDASTTDVPEATDVTGATYSGAGEAFGGRVLSEGGVNRIIESHNPATGACGPSSFDSLSPNAQVTAILDCPYNAVDSNGDRDWYLGHAGQASLTNVGAAGFGSAVDVGDSATPRDFQNANIYGTTVQTTAVPSPLPGSVTLPGLFGPLPSASPLPSPSSPPPAARFPVDRPQDRPNCDDFGGAPATKDESHSFGTGSVSCDQNGGSVIAAGYAQPGGGAASLLGSSMSYSGNVEVHRTAASGVVTTATADVQHISLPPVPVPTVYIREIKTIATTSAHGRPGTASGSFVRHIYGFSSIGQPNTPMSYSCSDDDPNNRCNPQKVADAITAALTAAGFNAAAYVPDPDPAFKHGTPGGFQAVIAKDSLELDSDKAVNDDNSDTVVGLSIIFYNDGAAGRSREIVQFAGVHAESHYGIYLLGSGSGDVFGPPTTPDGPVTVITGTVDQGTTKTIVKTVTGKKGGILGALQQLGGLIEQGWRLLVSDPATAAALAGLWALLVSPVYLAMRRRALLGKIALPRGG